MINFIGGFLTGIVACTIGLSGIATLADRSIDKFQEVVRESAK
jgi:hypothetical protein